ncbi:MAG: 50S ribosomal protein L22, partial [Candidatus Omnitrophica bacterium]|nr:50S ribosomal protein L22 [Candidatus Omnitrophota bacterium]
MVSKAIVRYVRLSPRKTRLVADMVRGKNIGEALAILANLHKRASMYVNEVLKSAIANAKRFPEIETSALYISKITVDGGPMFKRYRAGSMGRAIPIAHRTSHIAVELDVKQKKSP